MTSSWSIGISPSIQSRIFAFGLVCFVCALEKEQLKQKHNGAWLGKEQQETEISGRLGRAKRQKGIKRVV